MTHEQFSQSEIEVIQGYYRQNAVKISNGVSKNRRGIHVMVGNVDIHYVREPRQYEWQIKLGYTVLASGSHVLLEAVLYDSQQAIKKFKQLMTALEVKN